MVLPSRYLAMAEDGEPILAVLEQVSEGERIGSDSQPRATIEEKWVIRKGATSQEAETLLFYREWFDQIPDPEEFRRSEHLAMLERYGVSDPDTVQAIS